MKLFKHKQQIEEKDDDEYWKDPRLDDEGTYDFYVCDKPDNEKHMCWSTCKCDDCGKEPRFKRYGEAWSAYWYCYDGWDGDSGFVCWKCMAKSKVHAWNRKRKEKRKKKNTFKDITNGLKLTKEQKKLVKEVMMRCNSKN